MAVAEAKVMEAITTAAVTATVATATVVAAIATVVAEASGKASEEAAAPLLKCLLQGHPLTSYYENITDA